MVVFRIERRSGVPAYLQIVRQVEQALRMGAFAEGDRLPTAARVAADTKVNPNTTLKAYRELERSGLVEVRQGAGTFITRTLATPADRARVTFAGAPRRLAPRGEDGGPDGTGHHDPVPRGPQRDVHVSGPPGVRATPGRTETGLPEPTRTVGSGAPLEAAGAAPVFCHARCRGSQGGSVGP